MGIHKNAPLTPAGREILVRRIVDEGQTPAAHPDESETQIPSHGTLPLVAHQR